MEERLLLKLLVRWLSKRGLIQGCNYNPLLVSQRSIHVSMEEVRAKCKTKHPMVVLDPAWLEARRSQQREVPSCLGFEGEITVNSLRRWICCHQRELQVRGPQLFMKKPVRGRAKRLPLTEQPRARGTQAQQV